MVTLKVLFLATDLGHYIANAHVPLHTTLNYNGQLSNQSGFHAFLGKSFARAFSENFSCWVDNEKKSAKYPTNKLGGYKRKLRGKRFCFEF